MTGEEFELPSDVREEIDLVVAKTGLPEDWLVSLYRRGYNAKLGPTGHHPFGKLNKSDEGELRVALGLDRKNSVIRIEFGKPVGWVAVPAAGARHLAKLLVEKADELDRLRS
jgi:hypothetical protein